jgi:hypothetical protein
MEEVRCKGKAAAVFNVDVFENTATLMPTDALDDISKINKVTY